MLRDGVNFNDLTIGMEVRLADGTRCRVADLVNEHEGIYTVLLELGRAGKRPLLKYASIQDIKRAT